MIISVALGVLSWRSYKLAERMEIGIQTYAVEYLHHAAEISAQRIDAAISNRMFAATSDWQQVERRIDSPDTGALASWIDRNSWILSAIYVPDDDPLGSIYVSESTVDDDQALLTNEFYTASGAVRYSYDPLALIDSVQGVIATADSHSSSFPETIEVRQQSKIELVETPASDPPLDMDHPAVVVPLAEPLGHFAVRASIGQSYIGAGWSNHRVVSLWLAVIAMILVIIAAMMAAHGLRKEAETVRLRSALIANVSHELRTPLSMIRLGTETLRRNPTLQESHRDEIVGSIHREAMHLSHLVENVLDVARMDKRGVRLVRAPVDPQELVRSLVSSYESWLASKGFSVELEIDSEIGEQMWDREAISRALLNLVDNAVKYSEDDRHLVVRLRDRDDRVEISVEDHGIGLHAPDLQRVFEPYYRARFSDTQTRRGAGLGLTLVQQIIRAHGGTIEIDSSPGKGSTFRLLLPKPGETDRRKTKRLEPPTGKLVSESGETK